MMRHFLWCKFHEILHQNHNISWLNFHEKLNKNHNFSWLHISWDITPGPQYLIIADFMRYYTPEPKISHGCWFYEIWHQKLNISWLQILWDITPEPQHLIFKSICRLVVLAFCLFCIFVFFCLSVFLSGHPVVLMTMSCFHCYQEILRWRYLINCNFKKHDGVKDKTNSRDASASKNTL